MLYLNERFYKLNKTFMRFHKIVYEVLLNAIIKYKSIKNTGIELGVLSISEFILGFYKNK